SRPAHHGIGLPRHRLPRPRHRSHSPEHVQCRPAHSHRRKRRPAHCGDHRMIRHAPTAALFGAAVCVSALALSASDALAQRTTKQPNAGGAVGTGDGATLVFLSDKRPVLLRIHIHVDGKPVDEAWNAYLKRWFDYLDRDGDGKLSAKEV